MSSVPIHCFFVFFQDLECVKVGHEGYTCSILQNMPNEGCKMKGAFKGSFTLRHTLKLDDMTCECRNPQSYKDAAFPIEKHLVFIHPVMTFLKMLHPNFPEIHQYWKKPFHGVFNVPKIGLIFIMQNNIYLFKVLDGI